MDQSPKVAGHSPFKRRKVNMLHRSFETLNQYLGKMQALEGGRLYLSRYVTLGPGNREAEAFLGHLEEEGYLPPTVAWVGKKGKVRLFRAPDGAHPLTIHCNGLALALRTGGGDSTYVDCRRWREGSYKVFGDPAYLIMNPVRLSWMTFEFFRLLSLMPPRSIDLQQGEAQRKSGS
jgi:hypothetical protein